MEAYVVVLQNPYFAVTGSDGHYRIENVPPGAYSRRCMGARKARRP